MTDEPRPEDQSAETGSTATAVETPPDEPAKKLTQTVEMKDVGPCKKHVKVIVDRQAIDDRLKEKFKELVGNSVIPGFRPGKAPARLVQKRYRTEVSDQVKSEVLLASLEQMAEESELAPLSAPNIDPTRIVMPAEGPFVYEFEVEVRPEFDLPDYKGLTIKRPVYAITDADVDREIRRLRLPDGQVVPKPEGNVQVGDVVVADLVFKDGETVVNEVKETAIRVEPRLVLQDALAPRFGEQVKGANVGDRRVVDLELSAQSANEQLAGKTIAMELTVKDVKTIRLPELTEEYLLKFHVRTEEMLRELIRAILERKLQFQQRQDARRQIIEKLAGDKKWDLPRDLLIRQARKAMQRKAMEMQSDGLSDEQMNNRLRMMQQDVLRSTELSLLEHFILQKIAETEKIEVKDEDLESEIDRIAAQQGESARRIRARLEREDSLDALAAEMIERRALDLILESAVYEDVQVGTEDDGDHVTSVSEQAVPGAQRDLVAETLPPASDPDAPQS